MKTLSTKRALLASVLSLLLCVTMLVGSTFAWFTDTATASVNTIQAGTLDVALEMKDNDGNWVTAEGKTLQFLVDGRIPAEGTEILWEPGCTYSLPALRIVNGGNLALKYKVVITGIKGDAELNDVIDWTIGDAALGDAKSLAPNAVAEFTVTGHMKETAGNAYQGKSIDGISITVVATQDSVEHDTNGNTYDKFAEFDNISTVLISSGSDTEVNDAVKSAISSAAASLSGESEGTQIILPENVDVTIDSGVATAPTGKVKNIKIAGTKDNTVKFVNNNPGSEGSLSYQDGANLTFQGITIDAGSISGFCARGGVTTFIDCDFKGELKKTIGSRFVFSDCTFEASVSQVGYGCSDVIFDGCVFNTDVGYGIKIYSEGSTPVNLTVRNCKFRNDAGVAKSAIFLDHIIDGITYNITVESCTFDGFTATPTPNYNRWATRVIVDESFVMSGEQYIFSYQTGEAGGAYHKILTSAQLVITLK